MDGPKHSGVRPCLSEPSVYTVIRDGISMNTLQDEIDSLRMKCIGCGKCSLVCPSLKHGGCDPKEIMIGNDRDILQCIACGNCSRVCRRTDPFTVMRDLISIAKGLRVSQAFKDTGYAQPMDDVPSRELKPEWTGDDAYIMPGCMVKCKVPYVEYAASKAMKAIGVGCRELEGNTCCMHPPQFREMTEFERRRYKSSMGAAAKGKSLIALCCGCSDDLNESGVDAVHIIPYLAERLDSLPKFSDSVKVAIEPGCSAMRFGKEMRAIVESMGCKVVNSKMGCCGKYSPQSEKLMEEREAECAGAEFIVVGCPMCLIRYEDCPEGLPTVHIAELVAMSAGDWTTLEYHKIKP